jgi:hypothetical protein
MRAAVFLEDGVTRNYALELTRVSAVDYRDERINIHIAQCGIEGEIRVETGH